jgi:ATP-dependent DNA helicase RecG
MQNVLDYISAHGQITDKEIQSLLGIKKTRAFELMKRMRNLELVRMIGRCVEKKYLVM